MVPPFVSAHTAGLGSNARWGWHWLLKLINSSSSFKKGNRKRDGVYIDFPRQF